MDRRAQSSGDSRIPRDDAPSLALPFAETLHRARERIRRPGLGMTSSVDWQPRQLREARPVSRRVVRLWSFIKSKNSTPEGFANTNDQRLTTRVLARDSKHAGALSALGRVAFEQKRYPEAIDLLQRATASDDSLREAHYYLGLTFARLGRQKEADSELQIATRLEYEEAQHRRTVLRIQDGQGDQHANSDPKE